MVQVYRFLTAVSLVLGIACGRSGLTSIPGTGGRVVSPTGGIVGPGGSALETGGSIVASTGGLMVDGHPWPSERHDPRGTRQSPVDTSKNEGRLVWRLALGMGKKSSPVIAKDGTVVVSDFDRTIFAITPPSANAEVTIAWTYSPPLVQVLGFPGTIGVGQPMIGTAGQVFVNYWDTLFAIVAPPSGAEGVVLWKATGTGQNAPNQPLSQGNDGTVFTAAVSGKLLAINEMDGSLKWTANIPYYDLHPVISAPDGTLYTGIRGLNALPSNDGNQPGGQAWTFAAAHAATPPVVGDDGTVFVGTTDLKVNAISPPSGGAGPSLKWSYFTGCMSHHDLAIGLDGTLYVVGHDWDLIALAPNTASRDGELRWRWYHPGYSQGLRSSPAVGADGTVYVAADSTLYAIRPPTSGREGTTKWTFHTVGTLISSPAIGADGAVYITDDEGYLYAIK